MTEIHLDDWKKLGIPEEMLTQLRLAGINCAEAFRQMAQALGESQIQAKDFADIPLLRELKENVEIAELKQPNFSRFQNNFKRRGR